MLPKEFVGEKLTGEILSQIDQAEMEKLLRPKLRFESNFDWLLELITKVKVSRDKQRSLEEFWNNPGPILNSWSQEAKNMYQDWLEAFKGALEMRENQLYQVIKITVFNLAIVDV